MAKGKQISRVVGIDIGNGMVKIRTLDLKTGKPYILVLPSAWAYKKAIGENVHNKELKLDTFVIDDVEYVWGEDIPLLDDIKITYGHENRYKTEAFKIMTKIAMAKIVHDLDIQPTEKILVVTGVPSGESNTELEQQLSKVFTGSNKGIHEVAVNTDEYMFKVAQVEVMSQPVATVMGRYLDEEGYVSDEDYEDIKVAVIDIGSGTIDFDIIDKLRRLKEYHSVPKGFRDVYDAIRETIKMKYPSHDVTDYELINCLNTRTYKPSRLKEEVNFSDSMDKGITELVVDIQQAIMSKWKDQTDLDEILLIGASAKEFDDKLSDVVTGLTIPDNHDVSNVEGYYRWGVYLVESDNLVSNSL